MSNKSPIQWTDSTCNPVMGCQGCELWNKTRKSCYAGEQHEKLGAYRLGYSPTFDQITFWPGRMAGAAALADLHGRRRHDKPWLDGMPRLIFVSDMGDALCDIVPFDYLRMEVIENVRSPAGRRHYWLWLTKRPKRMAEFSGWLDAQGISWPANLWAGTTITAVSTTTRIDELLKVGNETTTRFLSVEPQLESLDLRPWLPRLDWIIQGGESGTEPRKFDLTWAQQLYWHCQETGTAYFLKQLGGSVFRGEERIRLRDHHGDDWSEWPKDVPRVRQIPAPKGLSGTKAPPAKGHFCDGNRKLGPEILSFDISPLIACPGSKQALCRELRPDGNAVPKPICWACRGCYREQSKKERLAENFLFSKGPDFVPWANKILSRSSKVLAVRITGTGDSYNVEFVAKVRAIVQANPRMKFWGYTKSWTVPAIWEELLKLGAEPNMVLWLSWDRKMAEHHGAPPDRTFPWCWLAERDDDLPPEPVPLVWRYSGHLQWNEKLPYLPVLGGSVVCPHEDGRTETTCAKCGICWRGAEYRIAKTANLLEKSSQLAVV